MATEREAAEKKGPAKAAAKGGGAQRKRPPRRQRKIERVPGYNGLGVFLEQNNGEINPVSWELCGIGRELADKMNDKLYGIIAGHNVEHLAQEAIYRGCDVVHVIDAPELADYRNWAYTHSIHPIIEKLKLSIFLLGATSTGRDLSGTLATTLQTGLTADCTELDVDPENDILDAIRPAFLEKQLAVILCRTHRPQMATVRPRVMEPARRDTSRTGEIVHEEFNLKEEDIPMKVIEVIDDARSGAYLDQAEVIVAGGMGLGESRNLHLVEEMADSLGAVVGASRPVVDAGWIPYEHQVGQTGTAVRPKVYVALGISGAIQHLVGMQNSEIIVAVNRDESAPIFSVADYGIVGDLFTIAPLLTEELSRRLAEHRAGGGQGGGPGGGDAAGKGEKQEAVKSAG